MIDIVGVVAKAAREIIGARAAVERVVAVRADQSLVQSSVLAKGSLPGAVTPVQALRTGANPGAGVRTL